MNIKDLALKYNDYVIEQRRLFHRFPEPSLNEIKTTKLIVAELEKMGIDVELFGDMPGCVGILRGGKSGKTVLLRADIDGLPVPEQTGLPFTSEHDGFMHACGHDCHIAMQLAAAKILSDVKDELCGTVKFFFQSGEEVAQGANMAIANGLLDGVDAALSMHIWGQVDAGKLNFELGPRMACADVFTLEVFGTAAHGSAPQYGKDALLASAAVVMNIQQIVSRMSNPTNPLVVTIGTMVGGQRFNIIADKISMDGTTRTFDRKFRMEIEGMMREIAESTAKAYGCTAKLNYNYLASPVVNDNVELLSLFRDGACDMFGNDIFAPLDMVMGAEDFAAIQERVPAIHGMIGGRSKDVAGSEKSNHHPCYTIDESVLHMGSATYARFAYDFLNTGR